LMEIFDEEIVIFKLERRNLGKPLGRMVRVR